MSSINWGIVSTGNIARKFTEALKVVEGAKTYAVASRNIESAQQFAKEFSIPNAYGSYDALINDENIDVVYIGTPHPFHMDLAIQCLENGKHVLCEKPLGINSKQTQAIVDASRKSHKFLMEALWTRFLPTMLKVEELLSKNAIGNIVNIKADFSYYAQFDEKHRLFNPDLAGGSILDVGIYPLFLARFIGGDFKNIHSYVQKCPTGVDSFCSMHIEHENGIISNLTSGTMVSGPISAQIIGDKGRVTIEAEWHRTHKLHLIDREGKRQDFEYQYAANGYEYEAMEVMKCIKLGKIESDLFPQERSIYLSKAMDEIRAAHNIKYPFE